MTQQKWHKMEWRPGHELKDTDCPVLATVQWKSERKPDPMAGVEALTVTPMPTYVVLSSYHKEADRWVTMPAQAFLDPSYEIIAWQPIKHWEALEVA